MSIEVNPLEQSAPPSASPQAALAAYVLSLEDEPEPLRRVVGHARVQLMEMANFIADRVKRSLSEPDKGLDGIDDAASAMQLHLKYHQVFERYEQMDAKLALRRELPYGPLPRLKGEEWPN